MTSDEIAEIAEQVSVIMQLDRNRHNVSTELNMKALANVPAYIASVFEEANAVGSDMPPADLYRMINKRISQIQAQLYLMRIEMDNRHTRDPSSIYEDPLAISAYGERVETVTRITRVLDFMPDILAYGWYPIEQANGEVRRWMRPGEVSVACLPHLGKVDQIVEVHGYVLTSEQLEKLEVRVGETVATIEQVSGPGSPFVAKLELKGDDINSANYLPVEFRIGAFEQPNQTDTRLLGANIGRFVIRPLGVDPIETNVIVNNAMQSDDLDAASDPITEGNGKADT